MLSMKWLNANKGLSSTLNWIFPYFKQKNLLESWLCNTSQPISLHFAEKAPFREKRFITKILDTTPKLPTPIALLLLKYAGTLHFHLHL